MIVRVDILSYVVGKRAIDKEHSSAFGSTRGGYYARIRRCVHYCPANLADRRNDPHIQLAQDTAYALQSGQSVSEIDKSPKIDIGRSLASYVVVYDDKGQPVAGSGLLHGQLPVLPSGVFDYTRRAGEDRLTWQPEPGVRSAMVVERYEGAQPGFVMAGRSLLEVEKRIDLLLLQVGAAWVGTLFITFVTIVFVELLLRR